MQRVKSFKANEDVVKNMSFLYICLVGRLAFIITSHLSYVSATCVNLIDNHPPPPFCCFLLFTGVLAFFGFKALSQQHKDVSTSSLKSPGLWPEAASGWRVFESAGCGKIAESSWSQGRGGFLQIWNTPQKNPKNKHPSMKMVVFMMFFHKFPHTQWMSECVFFFENCLGNAFQIVDQLHGWTWESFLDCDFVTLDYNIPLSPRELSLASFDSPTSGKSENQCGHHKGWLLKILLLMSANFINILHTAIICKHHQKSVEAVQEAKAQVIADRVWG